MYPIVSIIIPIYNVEQYVRQCLESVIGQTIDHSLLECIVVNDCTPDKSMEIVGEIVEKYRNEGGSMQFKLMSHDKNKGLSASRNTGMKPATGEFIFFIDSDDYIYPDSLKILMHYHLHEPEADLIMGNHYDELNNANFYTIRSAKTVRNKNLLFFGKTKKNSAWNSLVSRKLLVDNNIEFVEGIYFEDNVFNYQLIPLVKCTVITPEVTYFYRKNPKGIMLAAPKEKVEKVVNDNLQIFALFLENLKGKCYIGKSIATLDKSIILYDYIFRNTNKISDLNSVNNRFIALCNQLLLSHLYHFRIFLLLLSMMLVPPLNRLIKCRIFRQNYVRIVFVFGLCAIGWEKVLSVANLIYVNLKSNLIEKK